MSPTFMKFWVITTCQDTYKYWSHSYAEIMVVFLFFHSTAFWSNSFWFTFRSSWLKMLSIQQLWLFYVRPSSHQKRVAERIVSRLFLQQMCYVIFVSSFSLTEIIWKRNYNFGSEWIFSSFYSLRFSIKGGMYIFLYATYSA